MGHVQGQDSIPPALALPHAAPPLPPLASASPVRALLCKPRCSSVAIPDQDPGSGPLSLLSENKHCLSLVKAAHEGGRVPAGHTPQQAVLGAPHKCSRMDTPCCSTPGSGRRRFSCAQPAMKIRARGGGELHQEHKWQQPSTSSIYEQMPERCM